MWEYQVQTGRRQTVTSHNDKITRSQTNNCSHEATLPKLGRIVTEILRPKCNTITGKYRDLITLDLLRRDSGSVPADFLLCKAPWGRESAGRGEGGSGRPPSPRKSKQEPRA